MFVEAALLAWSGLALVWWGISLVLVRAERGVAAEVPIGGGSEMIGMPSRLLTIFKPLPPLGKTPFNPRGFESFLAQLDDNAELLLGIHEPDRAQMEPWLARAGEHFPQARLRIIWRNEPDSMPNPKIAWLKMLAPHATGELWLWSDADIIAPPDFLHAARKEYASARVKLITWPYVIRERNAGPPLLDALYVNAEFFPGVLLLRRLGPVDFGLGAAMLFARADFEAAMEWSKIGSALADDFILGQKLQPVRIGSKILETRADESAWSSAIAHYLRWSKTVRWNKPGGTAARIFVLPILGWLVFIGIRPLDPFGWLGLVAIMQLDVLAAILLLRTVKCPIKLRDLPALELWSIGRALAWLACWLPWPVVWSGRSWWCPIDKT